MSHRPLGYSVSTSLSERLRGNLAQVRSWVSAFNSERREKFTIPLRWVELIEREQDGLIELDLIGHLANEEANEFRRIILTPYTDDNTFTRIDCTLTDWLWALDYCSVLAAHLREVGGDKELSRLQRGIIEAYGELRSNSMLITDESIARALGDKGIVNPKGELYARETINRRRNELIRMGYDLTR